MGAGLRTGLEAGGLESSTDCTLLVVVLVPLLVTHGLVVEGTDTAADHLPAVFSFLGLFLRFLLVPVQADFSLTAQSGLTESEDLW